MHWYILQTQPLYENKVMEQIEARKRERNLTSIERFFAPEETIVDYKNGVKKERKKKLYSNYVFIRMEYSNETHHELKGIKGVKGFVGNKANPTRISDEEIAQIESKIAGEGPKHRVEFEVESSVKIIGGGFDGYTGVIKSVDYEKNKAKIEVHIFGRGTVIDIELNAIETVKE